MKPPPTLLVGSVTLTVHDPARVAGFYERVVGLHRLAGDGEEVRLGVGGRTLMRLRRDRAARVGSPREAGLFHTAFLLPDRAALGRWLAHAAGLRLRLQGAADHAVSEALYLADPEGNGVEIYADRPPGTWRREGAMVAMTTEPLDLADLLAAGAGGAWRGIPEAGRIGHVHLQVGEAAAAEPFYAGALGLEVTGRFAGAAFFAADRYHHHLATNSWNSRGAPPRTGPATGLSEIGLEVDPARLALARAAGARADGQGGLVIEDPWRTALCLLPLPDAAAAGTQAPTSPRA